MTFNKLVFKFKRCTSLQEEKWYDVMAMYQLNCVVLSLEFHLVMSCHVVSCHVVSCHVVSCRVVSCRVVSCCVMSFLVGSGQTGLWLYTDKK